MGFKPFQSPRSWVRGFICTCTRNVYPQVLVSLFFNGFLQGVLSAQDSDGMRLSVFGASWTSTNGAVSGMSGCGLRELVRQQPF